MTTRRHHRQAAVAAYKAFQARELARQSSDTRQGARFTWLSDQEGLGQQLFQGAAIRRALAVARASRGHDPAWLDLDRHTRVHLESIRQRAWNRVPFFIPHNLDRLEAYERRGFRYRFDPRRLP